MLVSHIKFHQDNTRLLIVMAGWSTDRYFYEHLILDSIPDDWNCEVWSDFDSDDEPVASNIRYHDVVYVLAWSMGVAAAERLIPPEIPAVAVAVNGTPVPADDRYGIPRAIYNGTFENLDTRNLKKFHRRMMKDGEQFKKYLPILPIYENVIIDQLKSQLLYFMGYTYQEPKLYWSKVIIGMEDKIFPTDNQYEYWKDYIPASHIEFRNEAHFMDLGKVIASMIPDLEKVGKRFEKASVTYNDHAIAQKMITGRMASLLGEWESLDEIRGGDILEIGPGTGLFSRKYFKYLLPTRAKFIDLYDIEPFGFIPNEEYIVGDGEQYLNKCEDTFDCILSTSAIQWFVDVPRFISNSFRHLRKGGMLICSTFLPGNLKELVAAGGTSLMYLDKEEIEVFLKNRFSKYELIDEEIKLVFASAREALMHLKYTGVAGSANPGNAGKIMESLRDSDGRVTLTYHPLYILAQV